MFDVDRLNEALGVPARPLGSQVRSMEGWYALPLDVIDQRTIAARLVVAGQPLRRCEIHGSSASIFSEQCDTGAFLSADAEGKGFDVDEDDCVMVEGWWMPTGEVDDV